MRNVNLRIGILEDLKNLSEKKEAETLDPEDLKNLEKKYGVSVEEIIEILLKLKAIRITIDSNFKIVITINPEEVKERLTTLKEKKRAVEQILGEIDAINSSF